MAKNNCFSVEDVRDRITDKRYIVEEFIGEGGMACVYRAKENGTPNIYALKVLKEQYRARDEFLEVFQREAINMRDLQHPNIVRFYKLIVEEFSAYILMDYINGRALTKYIQRARTTEVPFPIDEVVRIVTQVARALSHIHQEGFIHRDVKPGNVLLAEEDGRAYLTDLGIAGQSSDFALAGAGTPSYMPYEQQEGGLKVDHTVDIYAFGVMVFEMFTGEKPFRAPSGIVYEEARKILTGLHQSAPVPNITDLRPDLPKELNAVFQKALAKNPASRYRDVTVFAKDIHRILLPYLSPDLHDFENIEAKVIPDIKTIQQQKEIQQRTKSLMRNGAALVLTIFLLMAIALTWNNYAARQAAFQAASATVQYLTDAPTATLTETATPTLVDTSTNTPTPSDTPTLTATELNTDIPATSVAVGEADTPTPVVTPNRNATRTPITEPTNIEPTAIPTLTPMPIAFGADTEIIALPAGNATLDQLVLYALQEGLLPIPLNLNNDIQDFALRINIADLGNAAAYGIAFRVRDEHDYLLFYVDVAAMEWRVEERVLTQVENENGRLVWQNSIENPVLESHTLTELPLTLSLVSIDQIFQILINDEVVFVLDDEWLNGGIGLWFTVPNPFVMDANYPSIDEVTLDLLGDDALLAQASTPSMPEPALNLADLLVRDVQALVAVFDVDSTLVCDAYMPLFQRLAAHQQSLVTLFEAVDLAESVDAVIEEGRIIHNRCVNLGAGGELDPNDNVSDFLELDRALRDFLAENP